MKKESGSKTCFRVLDPYDWLLHFVVGRSDFYFSRHDICSSSAGSLTASSPV